MFGATVPVTLQAAAALRRLRRQRRRCRHPAGDVLGLQRRRPGAAGPPEPARPDGHVVGRARAAAGSARSIATPCPTCRGEGRVTSEHTYQVDVPGRRRLRLDAAPHRSRRGRTARRRRRRPLRAPARRRARALPARRRRPRHRRADLDRPGRARHDGAAADARRRRGAARPGRHAARAGVRAAQPGRARACRAAVAATCGPSSSSRCRRSSTTRRRRCCASSPSSAARPSHPPDKGLFSRIKSAFS